MLSKNRGERQGNTSGFARKETKRSGKLELDCPIRDWVSSSLCRPVDATEKSRCVRELQVLLRPSLWQKNDQLHPALFLIQMKAHHHYLTNLFQLAAVLQDKIKTGLKQFDWKSRDVKLKCTYVYAPHEKRRERFPGENGFPLPKLRLNIWARVRSHFCTQLQSQS